MWLVVQAHETLLFSPLASIMPTPNQLRCEVFTAIIHGATGIIYYAFDSWVMRSSSEVGIGPAPAYSDGDDWAGQFPANSSATLDRASAVLWETAAATNRELKELK